MSLFYAAEVDAYRPGGLASTPAAEPWGVLPWGASTPASVAVESYDTIMASDLGYRTRPADPGGVVVYPPFLDSAFAIDRRVPLAPGAAGAGASWGTLRLANAGGRYDAVAAASNSDNRGVRIYAGRKTLDDARGVLVDPPRASLTTLFVGVAQPWFVSDTALEIPIRDATYWLERPVQGVLYQGTGGLEGAEDLKGRPKPKARGIVRNISPVLVDAGARIYQWTDNSGALTGLFEDGGAVFTPAGNVGNLYSGVTNPGQYRTDNARGLFQLGSPAVGTITCNAVGNFITPSANSVLTAASIARWFCIEDMALPAGLIDVGSFTAADAAYPYQAGFYTGTEAIDGVTVVGRLCASIGATLTTARGGQLRVYALRAPDASTNPVIVLGRHNAASLTPSPLGEPLEPPPYRWRVSYGRNWTVQTGKLSGSISDTQRVFVEQAVRYGVWVGAAVLQAYRRPSDPPPVETYLTNAVQATNLADALGALWGVRRRLYDVVVPVEIGIGLDIGSPVRLVWPSDDLASGRIGQIVGEQFRSGESTITFQVLV